MATSYEMMRAQADAERAKADAEKDASVARLIKFAVATVIVVVILAMVGCPQYNVYSQEMSGRAKLAEAQSSRQVAVLEAVAKKESSKSLADAEVLRATGAAKANAILQNSLGGPEGYLRYLQIQSLDNVKANLIYVPTEGGLPVTEANRLQRPAPVVEE